MRQGLTEAQAQAELVIRPPRDYFLTAADVRNISAPIHAPWKLHSDEATSVLMHQQQRPDAFLILQQQELDYARAAGGSEDAAEGEVPQKTPFVAAVSTTPQTRIAAAYGSERPVLLDTTFSTNHLAVRKGLQLVSCGLVLS